MLKLSGSPILQNSAPQTIERQVPGSNLRISFSIRLDVEGRVIPTAHVTEGSQTIHQVPIELFNATFHSTNINEILKKLQITAIDYIRGSVIFLDENVDDLVADLQNREASSCTDESKNEYQRTVRNLKSILNNKHQTERIVDAYHRAGNEYFYAGEYHKALYLFQKMFQAASQSRFSEDLRLSHRNLGQTYFALGESQRAIQHHIQELQLFPNSEERGKAHLSLGYVFEACGIGNVAIAHFKSYLNLSKTCPELPMTEAYSSLGRVYMAQGDWPRAKKKFKKSIQIRSTAEALSGLSVLYLNQGKFERAIDTAHQAIKRIKSGDQVAKGQVYANLGLMHQKLGSHSKAREYHNLDLTIALQTQNAESEARARYNLCKLSLADKQYLEALENISTILPIIDRLMDRKLRGMIFGLMGHVYLKIEDIEQSIHYHNKHLESASQLDDPEGQICAYINLGKTYSCDNDYPQALEHYLKALAIATKIGARDAEAELNSNLGRIYYLQKDFHKARDSYRLSINIYECLHRENCKNNLQWTISFFNTQFRAYRGLEQTELEINKDSALLAADNSRARSLVNLLGGKLGIECTQPLTLEMIQASAARFQTTIILYSCDPFDQEKGWCWMVTPQGMIHYNELDLSNVPIDQNPAQTEDTIQTAVSEWIASVEKEAERGSGPMPEGYLTSLKGWFKKLIKPFGNLLPEKGERLTFIPDAFLHNMPFALLQDEAGEYLFEKYALFVAPSIQALLQLEELDTNNKPQRKLRDVCVVTNPSASSDYDLDLLTGVDQEGKTVAEFFNQVPPHSYSTVQDIRLHAGLAGHLHFSCHGVAEAQENIHSVFKGALAMEDRPLYTEDISKLSLNAELAFLSACHSGRGKIYQEGIVGLPFAFLAAGVSSVIATRWKIPDIKVQNIVREFYRHYIGESGKAHEALAAGKPFGRPEALREAMLYAKQEYPNNPEVWGAFCLFGLPGNLQNSDFRDPLIRAKTDKLTGNKFRLHLEEHEDTLRLRVTFFEKKGEGFANGIDFQESEIAVQTVSFAEIKAKKPQVSQNVSGLSREDKINILETLHERSGISVNERELIIRLKK